MKIIRTIDEMKSICFSHKSQNKKIGMVPTMGFLHEGHESLIKNARDKNDIVVVSIFVNPTQFGPDEDYDNYPRDLQRDSEICRKLGVDYVFHPDAKEMYPEGYSTFVIPSERMTNILCGVTRPGHFRGVCTILTKLFNIVSPDNAYFGKKDIQQLAIVKRMVKDFNFGINIIGCPIIREEDGLAKSSRNSYLSEKERKSATVLRKSILKGIDIVKEGERKSKAIRDIICETIEAEETARIDYVEILDFDTFDRVEEVSKNTLIAIAVYIGNTRLIDNEIVSI